MAPVEKPNLVGNTIANTAVFANAKPQATKRATYRNPVVNQSAADPSAMRAKDGTYYSYTTGSAPAGKRERVPVRSSRDLVNWKHQGDAMPTKPKWAKGAYMAPHVDQVGDEYRMYFSAKQKNGNMATGVAKSKSPTGPFKPDDKPLVKGKGFRAIDAFVHDAGKGRRYLYWGSQYEPIMAQRLSKDGTKLVGKAKAAYTPNGQRSSHETLIEGAWMVKRGKYHYMFVSGDRYQDHYAVNVGRSKSPTGPFKRKDGGPILKAGAKFNPGEGGEVMKNPAGKHKFHQPGHNATVKDDRGNDWMVYHAYQRGKEDDGRKLMLDRIRWKDGWPSIEGGRPSRGRKAAPVIDNP